MAVSPGERIGMTSVPLPVARPPAVPCTGSTGCVGHSRLAMYRLVPSEYTVSPSATTVTGSPSPRLDPVRSKVSTVSMELPEYDAAAGWLTDAQSTCPVRVTAPVDTE